jgi:hypothetical protein
MLAGFSNTREKREISKVSKLKREAEEMSVYR